MPRITIIQGDARKVLLILPEKSIYTCVTSPPYWGLRDYGLEPLIWGGIKKCDHEWGNITKTKNLKFRAGKSTTIGSQKNPEVWKYQSNNQFCTKCRAWRGSLGLEPTPEMYTDHLVEVFRKVKRVLRDDGTIWLNLGDSYSGSGGDHKPWHDNKSGFQGKLMYGVQSKQNIPNLKSKNLIGIPWRIAFALQADGWYLRSDIIWHKPNPTPESVRDRPTKSHEYVFLLSKSRKYYYDHEAIKEPAQNWGLRERKEKAFTGGVMPRRNKRSVWTITTKPFKRAHFAVFPKDLIEPCILAGSPENEYVLDPFIGAGTTALVASKHNRKCIGVELNPKYVEIAQKRIEDNEKRKEF